MYEWVKALHIISVIAWMAGILYLPRLYVYHANVEAGSEVSETFKVMERRLLKAIMTPAMIASFVFGIWMLVLIPDLMSEAWMHAKLACVFVMAGIHGYLAAIRKRFEADQNTKSHVFYRVLNEVPTVLMVVVVILVIVEPF